MPTYAYRCDSCGLARDEWLKMSEAAAERSCPSCGQPTYRKQITAPAFQLKGSGWYVTDFRNNGAKPADKKADGTAESAAKSDADAKPDAPAKTEGAAAEPPAKSAQSATSEASAGGDKPASPPPVST